MRTLFVGTAGLAALVAMNPCTGLAQVVEGSREGLTVANSMYGPTGLIVIPTAYVTKSGTWSASAAFGRNNRIPAVNYGLLPYIEVGGAFVDREAASNKSIANAKVSIIPSNFRWFEIGVGIIDAMDAINQTVYFVASADIVPPKWDVPDRGIQSVALKAHAGAGTGLFQEKFFGGGELLFSKKFSLVGEWDTKNVNAAIRYAPKDYVRLQMGVQGKDMFFSLTTTFDTK